ncbi:hypothetical protein MXB_4102 [Myxobolus squamalis]|nr:hypothetical protein MXB_4102 [Myxobolus squamalis]
MNDTFAYIVGITIGRTPLIKLSPKKTWEGFIGGGIITYIGSLCFNPGCHTFNITCKLPYFMESRVYQFPAIATLILPERISSLQYYPIYFHVLAISTFCSLLAPFGGFFASGFKRAFKIKDFGKAFPGHGGMLDRMDCQILLTIFVYVYTNTFVRFDKQQKIFNQILKLSPERQFELYEMLKNTLTKYGSLPK